MRTSGRTIFERKKFSTYQRPQSNWLFVLRLIKRYLFLVSIAAVICFYSMTERELNFRFSLRNLR